MNIELETLLPRLGRLSKASGTQYGELYLERLSNGDGRISTCFMGIGTGPEWDAQAYQIPEADGSICVTIPEAILDPYLQVGK